MQERGRESEIKRKKREKEKLDERGREGNKALLFLSLSPLRLLYSLLSLLVSPSPLRLPVPHPPRSQISPSPLFPFPDRTALSMSGTSRWHHWNQSRLLHISLDSLSSDSFSDEAAFSVFSLFPLCRETNAATCSLPCSCEPALHADLALRFVPDRHIHPASKQPVFTASSAIF